MLSLLLAVPSCIYSFWHSIIPTSYFHFVLFIYTCFTNLALTAAIYTCFTNLALTAAIYTCFTNLALTAAIYTCFTNLALTAARGEMILPVRIRVLCARSKMELAEVATSTCK